MEHAQIGKRRLVRGLMHGFLGEDAPVELFGVIEPVRLMVSERFAEQRLRGRPDGSCRSAALPSRRTALVTIHRGPPHRINHA